MSVDLTTRYLGLELSNPVVPSSSPLTGDVDSLRDIEAAGAGAVVLPSLFEEQIEHDAMEVLKLLEFGSESFAETAHGYFPELDDYNTGPDAYLRLVEQASSTLEIPVIASLNGTTLGGWTRHARLIEEAGASALELNVYLIPTDPDVTSEEVERRYLDLVAAVRNDISIPLALKIGPYFSSPAHMARRLVAAGADGLVLFNRFYQPDLDLEEFRVVPDVDLSRSAELRLPLRWIAILYGRVAGSLGVTTGVHTPSDVVKAMAVGADVAMTTSALLRNGPGHVGALIDGLAGWLAEHEYTSVGQLRGSMSQKAVADPEAFVRSNYMKTLVTYTRPAP